MFAKTIVPVVVIGPPVNPVPVATLVTVPVPPPPPPVVSVTTPPPSSVRVPLETLMVLTLLTVGMPSNSSTVSPAFWLTPLKRNLPTAAELLIINILIPCYLYVVYCDVSLSIRFSIDNTRSAVTIFIKTRSNCLFTFFAQHSITSVSLLFICFHHEANPKLVKAV